MPDNCKGILLLTGDDDQAYLESYEKQLEILGKIPITYFMHPLTRVKKSFFKKFEKDNEIDLGLHPDALENPEKYTWYCLKQSIWFLKKFRKMPFSVRNHGFLNKGYWGHLSSWLTARIRFSSNIPGFDGNILTGSLIPNQVVYNGKIKNHWSVLTSFGDGMLFSDKYTPETALEKIDVFANEMIRSNMPGVIVFNLHPQNIDLSKEMHQNIIGLIQKGFKPLTIRECYNWFNFRLL